MRRFRSPNQFSAFFCPLTPSSTTLSTSSAISYLAAHPGSADATHFRRGERLPTPKERWACFR